MGFDVKRFCARFNDTGANGSFERIQMNGVRNNILLFANFSCVKPERN